MAELNLQGVLSVVESAINAVRAAKTHIDQFRETGVVLNSESQEQVDAKIAELETEYNALYERVQNKLRGTGG